MKYDLIEIKNFYLNNLKNMRYILYSATDKYVIRFGEFGYPHLIGLHHFNSSWKGKNADTLITSGLITKENLKQINKKKYNVLFKNRVDMLYEIDTFLRNCNKAYDFIKIGEHNMDCDIAFYNHKNKKYYILSSFLDEPTHEFYSASSLLQFSDTDNKVLRYITPVSNPIIFNKIEIFENDTKIAEHDI